MKISTLVVKAVLACGLIASSSGQATVLTLPASNEMSVGVYGDFNVYSLDLLRQCAAAPNLDPRCLPSGPFPVQSAPGKIKDDVTVLQSAQGQSNFPSPFQLGDAVDDHFDTPTGSTSAYSMVGADTASGVGRAAFVGDQQDRWDISISLLKDYLDGHDLVFLFDNNQEGGADQIIFLWGQIRIVNAAGATVGGCFELNTSMLAGCGDTIPSDHVPVATDFCVDKNSGLAYNPGAQNDGDCAPSAGHDDGGYWVNNNVSTSVAEFAAFNQALHDAVMNSANSGYFLSINVDYFSNNAGAEQMWICSQCDIAPGQQNIPVPEPGSLPLALLGLLAGGVSLVRARRRRA